MHYKSTIAIKMSHDTVILWSKNEKKTTLNLAQIRVIYYL